MIISQTPVRLSFLGGGTDYPEYIRRHGGATLVATINKYTTITVHPLTQFADHSVRIHYSRVESVQSIAEIQHPSARECLRHLRIDSGVEIHYVSDLPSRTGLGSSSSATVGLLMALHAFNGEMVSRECVAAEAVHVEQELIHEQVGCQDQYACALGGVRRLEFQPDGRVCSDPVVLSPERLQAFQERLMLLYTGIQRDAQDVLDEQMERMRSGESEEHLQRLKTLVGEGIQRLVGSRDLSEFGELLHEAWMIKRGLSSKVSTPRIDEAYDRARRAGAVGGKLLGAGGGGFLLLYVEPYNHARVRSALPELSQVAFTFENTGSTLVYYRA